MYCYVDYVAQEFANIGSLYKHINKIDKSVDFESEEVNGKETTIFKTKGGGDYFKHTVEKSDKEEKYSWTFQKGNYLYFVNHRLFNPTHSKGFFHSSESEYKKAHIRTGKTTKIKLETVYNNLRKLRKELFKINESYLKNC